MEADLIDDETYCASKSIATSVRSGKKKKKRKRKKGRKNNSPDGHQSLGEI